MAKMFSVQLFKNVFVLNSGYYFDSNNRFFSEKDSDKEFKFTEWRPLEPNADHEEEDSVTAVYSTTRWGMRDVSSDTQLPYICEMRKFLMMQALYVAY